MAAKELYDYLYPDYEISPDKNVTLSVSPQAVLREYAPSNVVTHIAIDGSNVERINLGGAGRLIQIFIQYTALSAADAGTVMQFWYDEDYGNKGVNSFKFAHPDGHTYVVIWNCDFERIMHPTYYSNRVLSFIVLGVIADS